ncbi:MFS transporter [Paenibacillus luteus]|uniref:MFS transporter n=1 Tax=Paenibacillus luteus TaxID=2545753 RepID=UPI001143470C|nr:MFS transporter [Paenibacillus luteus]
MANNAFRKFIILWIGELVSSIGSGLTAFGLGVYVFQTTHSATAVSLVTLCTFLPMILLSPVGGVLADRFDRRLMMLLGDGGSALGLIYIVIVMFSGEAQLWQLCVGVTISSIFASLTDPAYKATITDLLPEEQFAKASGLVQLAGSSKYLFSPILAGMLLAVVDIEALLIIDICTVFITIITISAVRRSLITKSVSKKQFSLAKDLKEGWQVLVSRKGVFALTLLLTVVTFYMGILQTLFTPMVLPLSNAKTLGIVQSVSATGLLLGSLFIGVFSINQQYARVLSAGLFTAGIFFSLIGVSTNIYVIAAAGFLFFATLPFVNTSADVLIRTNIPNEAQGRAWGMIGVVSQFGYIAAYASAGLLSDYVFNPLMVEGGGLASTVGKWIGSGQGRGIALLFVVSGILVMALALVMTRLKSIRSLETK